MMKMLRRMSSPVKACRAMEGGYSRNPMKK